MYFVLQLMSLQCATKTSYLPAEACPTGISVRTQQADQLPARQYKCLLCRWLFWQSAKPSGMPRGFGALLQGPHVPLLRAYLSEARRLPKPSLCLELHFYLINGKLALTPGPLKS